MDDEQVSPAEFTDEEMAFLRFARFGELPARAQPSELIQSVETESCRDLPEPLGDPHEWVNYRAG